MHRKLGFVFAVKRQRLEELLPSCAEVAGRDREATVQVSLEAFKA
jgi:hypothetical protein